MVAAVYIGAAGAVIAGREQEQLRGFCPLLFHAGGQTCYAINIGVHIVDAEDGNLLGKGRAE